MKTFERIKAGHIIIPCTREMVVSKLGGFGICDFCNETDSKGFLIPVLNSWYCTKCKEDWEKKAVFYKEDVDYEEKKALQYCRQIALG